MPKEYSSSHFVAISARGPWGLLLCDCAGDVPSVPRLRTSGALPPGALPPGGAWPPLPEFSSPSWASCSPGRAGQTTKPLGRPGPLRMWAGRVLGSPAWKRPLRRTWGYRGVRVGEARYPGPPAPGSPLHPAIQRCRAHSPDSGGDRHPLRRRVAEPGVAVRCFCPVPGCGHGDAMRAAGWASHEGMRHHLDDHCSGRISPAPPA